MLTAFQAMCEGEGGTVVVRNDGGMERGCYADCSVSRDLSTNHLFPDLERSCARILARAYAYARRARDHYITGSILIP